MRPAVRKKARPRDAHMGVSINDLVEIIFCDGEKILGEIDHRWGSGERRSLLASASDSPKLKVSMQVQHLLYISTTVEIKDIISEGL